MNLADGPGEMPFLLGLLGSVQATVGKCEEALVSITRLERILELLPDGILPTAPMMVCLALTAINLDDHERAIRLYMPLLAFRGQHYWFLVDRVLGMLATLSSDWETAAIHLTAAQETAKHEVLLPELARTLLVPADVALGQVPQQSTPPAIRLLPKALDLSQTVWM